MIKLFYGFILWVATAVTLMTYMGPANHGAAVLISIGIFVVLPPLLRAIFRSMDRSSARKQAELDTISRTNGAEYEHQQSLRREQERLEMQAEVRVKELLATLELQHRLDTRKMEQLSKLKEDFANRQKTDMASLLGQLEAMRAGGR